MSYIEIRDMYAAAALQGLLAHNAVRSGDQNIAEEAMRLANALLLARKALDIPESLKGGG